jgi:hypothetical protein
LGGQIGRALRTRGFTSYQGSFDNARRAQDILDTLQELLDVGHQRAGTPAAFPSRLDGLKSRNKRMRNLLAELNRRGRECPQPPATVGVRRGRVCQLSTRSHAGRTSHEAGRTVTAYREMRASLVSSVSPSRWACATSMRSNGSS